MIEVLLRELTYLWYYFSVQFLQIYKYWIIGMLIGSAVSVFAKEKIHKTVSVLSTKKLGALSLIPASILGIASPLCMYGTIPVAASLARQSSPQTGIDDAPSNEGELAAFMMSSILLNPQLLFYSAALGIPMLIIRLVICFLCGIAAGLLVKYFFRRKKFFNFSKLIDGNKNKEVVSDMKGKMKPVNKNTTPCSQFPAPQICPRLIEFLKSLCRNIKATGLFFLTGIALSAVFRRYVPAENFARLFGSNRGFGLLMGAAVGVPLYACGGGTIPLLQTWLHNGMSAGSAVAFMITGPAAKITNLGALKIVLGVKHFLFYLIFAFVFALSCGLIINLAIR